jgi:hypothetical protein
MDRRRVVGSLGLVALVACGPASFTPDARSVDGTLLLQTGSGVTVLDLSAGARSIEDQNGVISPDHRSIYTYRMHESGTLLRQLDLDGDLVSKTQLREPLAARVVSGSGRLVALTPSSSSTTGLWQPEPRSETTILVVDGTKGTQRRYELEGNFEPEAFSVNDRRLYTIEYIPGLAPTHYRVRILRLATGEVHPIGRLKLRAPGQMRGTGRMQVYAPEGEVLYTLYTRQGPNYVHGRTSHAARRNTHAFVHVLNLRFGWAHCVDLPLPFGRGDAIASAIAISPDGRRLFVSDWTNGAVAVVDPKTLRVSTSREMELGKADDETFAATDGKTLYVAGNDQVRVIDAQTLETRASWSFDGEVQGLAASGNGHAIFVALEERILAVHSASGHVLEEVSAKGVDGIRSIAPSG